MVTRARARYGVELKVSCFLYCLDFQASRDISVGEVPIVGR